MIIGGMDEAGRGPVIGPIVFGLVVIDKEMEVQLRNNGVKDSKTLTLKRRIKLQTIIKANSLIGETFAVSASEIDRQRAKGINLNQIEITSFRHLLKPHASKIDILQLDAADVNEARFGSKFNDLISGKILSKHKGDDIFISVGAASILAKVERDIMVQTLQKKMDEFDPGLPKFGSGYPTDAKPFLQAFVKKYKTLPKIARASWKTSQNILKEQFGLTQTSLDGW